MTSMSIPRRRPILMLAIQFCAAVVLAQSPPASPQPAEINRQTVTEQRTQVETELGAAKAALAVADSDANAPKDHLQREVALLTEINLSLGQQLAALERRDELRTVDDQIKQDLARLRSNGPTEPRPFRFALLESIRDQLATAADREANSAATIESAKDSLAAAQSALADREKNRRRAKEQLDGAADGSDKSELSRAFRIAQLESRAADSNVKLRELELQNQKLEQEKLRLEKEFLQTKLEYVAREARFDKDGLEEILSQLDQRESEVNQALDLAKRVFETRDSAWIDARRRLDNAPTKEPLLVEEVEAKRLARQVKQREVALLSRQLQLIAEARTIWNRRFEAFNNTADDDTLREWTAQARESLAQVQRDIRRNSAELSELRKQNVTLDGEINSAADSPELLRLLEAQKRHIAEMFATYEDSLDRLEASRRLYQKLLAEIEAQTSMVTWTQRLANAWHGVKKVWSYELTAVQDNPITVSKVVIGLILLVGGTVLSRMLARWVGGRFLPRMGFDPGGAAAIQSLLFYFLVLSVAMLSLRVVNVPLTAFTILGGALAIGVGFGSQSIVNNFISGLIILTERPIRVGDLVQLDDMTGIITRVGLRSTRVRSPQNMDIIVPNSSFLEKNVINWTLSDDTYRAHVAVGVAYGSPTRDVSKLIRKAVTDHGKVLTKPEPVVLFSDFGDNALLFEVHFWIRMRRIMDRRVIESDIRHRIDSLFREADIVIAFPQRDVHLDAKNPIEVMLRNAEQSEDDDTGSEEKPARPKPKPKE